jgi:LacI family transcriptional regulator
MQDVATLAGVSIMTVSRTLSGKVSVKEELRTRVIDAIAKLDFRPNELARSLRAQRTHQIGLIVPNLLDPFFAICADAVSQVAKKHQYSVVITTSDEDANLEQEQIVLMARRNIEGIVLVPASTRRKRHTSWPSVSLPIVTLDRTIAENCYASVSVENKGGACMLVNHLIEHGCRRIIHLCFNQNRFTLRERDHGYQQAMEQANLTPEVISGTFTDEGMADLLRTLQSGGPFALFCSNNLMTRRALRGLSRLNLRIPEDVPLVGFDDFDTADLLKPGITVVRQPTHELGRTGAEILFAGIESGQAEPRKKSIILPVELIVRESCGSHR